MDTSEPTGLRESMSEKYSLSRRKALAGLTTIGVAGAGAGLGTTALFSDTEQFANNTIQAGTLDMEVTGEIVAANNYWENQNILGNPITADGEIEVGFQLKDFKPGDWFITCFTVNSVAENPFYLTLHGDKEKYREKEGASTEPEKSQDGSTTDNGWEPVGQTNAELGDKLLISYWEALDNRNSDPGRDDLRNLDNITNTETNSFYTGRRGDLNNNGIPGEDGVVQGQSSPKVGYTDAREFYFGLDQDPANPDTSNQPLGNGFASGDGILVGGVSNPVQVGKDVPNNDSASLRRRLSDPDEDNEAELRFYLCFELPKEVGNEVQGDALKGNLRFSAEQVRNNGDPRSG